MTVGSLFAGIGGFDLGFERAGFEIKWQVEVDDYASRVLAKHWPHVRRYGDIRAIDWSTVETVDVVCGGFPCQPHSLAGKRAASGDERDLWGEFARAIRGVRPRWVVAENVPGLLSSESGRFFGRVLGDLAESGYGVEWDCLPASAVGAPHQRDRVWIVAYAGGQQHEGGSTSQQRPAAAKFSIADADSFSGRSEQIRELGRGYSAEPRHDGLAQFVADTDSQRELQPQGCERYQRRRTSDSSQEMADAESGARQRPSPRPSRHLALSGEIRASEQWRIEPNVGRVAHGVPARVDRLKGLGNAVVPQVTEWIAHRIKEIEVA